MDSFMDKLENKSNLTSLDIETLFPVTEISQDINLISKISLLDFMKNNISLVFKNISLLNQYLNRKNITLKLIITIRNQYDLLNSMYFQNSEFFTPRNKNYKNIFYDEGLFSNSCILNYNFLRSIIINNFGDTYFKNDIYFLIYEMLKYDKNSFFNELILILSSDIKTRKVFLSQTNTNAFVNVSKKGHILSKSKFLNSIESINNDLSKNYFYNFLKKVLIFVRLLNFIKNILAIMKFKKIQRPSNFDKNKIMKYYEKENLKFFELNIPSSQYYIFYKI